RDPAHRDHAAVRLVRRLERARQLRPAGAADARLRPRQPGARVNTQLNRLAVVSVLLLVALVLGTTYWQAWAARGRAAKQASAIQRVAQFQIRRGLIYAGPAHYLLARNRKIRIKGQTFYQRRYPHDGLLAQTVGYSTLLGTQAGLEQSMNDYLTGA